MDAQCWLLGVPLPEGSFLAFDPPGGRVKSIIQTRSEEWTIYCEFRNRAAPGTYFLAIGVGGGFPADNGILTLPTGGAIALPAISKVSDSATVTAVAANLTTFAKAFRAYEKLEGDWPPDNIEELAKRLEEPY